MMKDLTAAQNNSIPFEADQYVQKWLMQKHDHVSIPAERCIAQGPILWYWRSVPLLTFLRLNSGIGEEWGWMESRDRYPWNTEKM
jgi:hypothetical protein